MLSSALRYFVSLLIFTCQLISPSVFNISLAVLPQSMQSDSFWLFFPEPPVTHSIHGLSIIVHYVSTALLQRRCACRCIIPWCILSSHRIEKEIEDLETHELNISANEEVILKRLKEVERTAEDIIKVGLLSSELPLLCAQRLLCFPLPFNTCCVCTIWIRHHFLVQEWI